MYVIFCVKMILSSSNSNVEVFIEVRTLDPRHFGNTKSHKGDFIVDT